MNSLNHHRQALTRGHGTVGNGDGHLQPSVNYDPHCIHKTQCIKHENCAVSINPFTPNPFITRDIDNTWNDNYLILKDPRLRTLSGIAPLDRGFYNSSKHVADIHAQPCYTPYRVQYSYNGIPVPKAGHPHS